MAHRVLDVVSEDPEEPHVAEDVEPRAVQEHRGEDTQVVRVSGRDALEAPAQRNADAGGHTAQELSGDESPFTGGGCQRVRRAGALEKDPDDDIGGDDADRDSRSELGRVVVFVGEEHGELCNSRKVNGQLQLRSGRNGR